MTAAVVALSCLVLVMRGGARDNVESQLSALHGLRQLAVDYKSMYCTGGAFSLTQDQRDRYKSERKVMKTQMPKNPIEEYLLIGGSDKGDAAKAVIAFVAFSAIWILFLIMSMLGCLCYVCCCCCDKCCPPCECCRRDYDKKPISKTELNVCLIFLMLFSAPLFVIGIWGMASAAEIPDSMTVMQCAMVSFPANLLYGVQTANGGQWIGVQPLANKLVTIKDNLQSNINSIQNQMSDTTFVKTRGDALKTKIGAIPTNFQNKLVQAPNQAAVNAIQMNYLKFTGPVTDPSALSYRLDKSALAQVTAIGAMLEGIKAGLDSVTPSMTPITNAIDSGVTALRKLENDIEKIYTDVGKSGEGLDNVKGPMVNAIRNFFVWMIIFGAINVVFGILIMLCQFKKGRIFLHISWCCMGFSMISMFLILSILYPLSFVLFNLCEVLQIIMESEAKMNTLDLGIGNVMDKVKICLWNSDPSGNIAKSFGIDGDLDSINKVTGNFNSFLDKLDPNSPNYIDINKITGDYLNLEIGMAHGYTVGRLTNVTLDISTQDLSNPGLAIKDLNTYTNSAESNSCSSYTIDDHFVYSSLDCPSDRNSSAKTFANATWTATQDLGNAVCIPVIEMSTASLATRYAAYCAACSSPCASAKTKFGYLKGYDDSRREAYKELELAIGSVKTDMTAFGDELITKVSPLSGIKGIVDGFVTVVKTVMDELNCTFLYTDLQNLVDAMCIAYVPALSNIVKLIAAGSICFFFSTLTAFVSAMKVSKMEKQNDTNTGVTPANVQMVGMQQPQMVQQGYIPVQPMVIQQQAYPMAKY